MVAIATIAPNHKSSSSSNDKNRMKKFVATGQQRQSSVPLERKQDDRNYALLLVKIALVVLFSLPKLVTGAQKHRGKQQALLLRRLRYKCQNSQQPQPQQQQPQQVKDAATERDHYQGSKIGSSSSSHCGDLIPEESHACVSRCMSLFCYEQVYGSNPLEDGEVDVERGRAFEACVYQNEIRKSRNQMPAASAKKE
jgi:Domain of unknown function (DUF4787)